ncbi:MAG: 2-oxoacid:acceptor oxidoreductase family protein, partial [Caldilinea sp.]|nr:2-oxoacid:acceptor oxidoreductase family protein [Caldilinea sp.]
MSRVQVTIDGNEAAAYIAYKTNEVAAIYPITPSSAMGELADAWSAAGMHNLWGNVPTVIELQSEGGAAGTVHGALQTGSLTTTFTASQGLLLMIPNMYKIAGELTCTVFQIAARSLAAQGLSIFGDHSDVMAARSTGWAMLFANSVQEVMDMALIAQASTLAARVPFLHIFDGFRTSHEVAKIEQLADEDIRALIDDDLVRAHRARALNPEHPFMRGTAQNPDTYFQARETVNPYYLATPGLVQEQMDKLGRLVGRQYHLFDYVGAPDADRVLVLMGSGAEAVHETVEWLNACGERVGLVKVRLFRPFSVEDFVRALPPTVKAIAVLDRTKEPGAAGEPLYQDVLTALAEGMMAGWSPFVQLPRVIGGRYGLASKEFTPAMVKGVFEELRKAAPKNHFTVGILDDVTHTSLDYDPAFSTEPAEGVRALFWGLGSDGTVGANKNSIKIIGEETDYYAQGYFVYDSKKSGARTVSHLRFGPRPIRSTYLIQKANFRVARDAGMAGRINTVMQVCFFAISNVIPKDDAIAKIKKAIVKTYGKRGEAVVRRNYAAVDATLANLYELTVPEQVTSTVELSLAVPAEAPAFVQEVTARMIKGEGDLLPVSALPVDGTYPTATTQWEKRNIALEVPVWDPDLCIQCGKCVYVCPHAVIRSKLVQPELLADAPEGFLTAGSKWREFPDRRYTLQVAVEDCTGCQLCVEVCPAKNKQAVGRKAINMEPQLPLREQGARHWDFFTRLPETEHIDTVRWNNVKNVQLLQPLFEFSGACAGCGETPYLKLISQLYGDRSVIANATGCSSIYGGNLPTTPWSVNPEGRGPAWSNSLFEDNAEFGLGMRVTLDKQREYARDLVQRLRDRIGVRKTELLPNLPEVMRDYWERSAVDVELVEGLLGADQREEIGIAAQRVRVEQLKQILEEIDSPEARDLLSLADKLVRKDVWIVGGDGWAYDIGYGGVDHVLASGRNVNIVVLDTEVYSNTGGQSSK